MTAIERDVFPLGFGRYGVFEGTLIARGLTRERATQIAAADPREIPRMLNEDTLSKLRARRTKLYSERAAYKKTVDELALVEGALGTRRREAAALRLERCEQVLKSLLAEEVELTEASKLNSGAAINLPAARPTVDGNAVEAEAAITELENITAACDERGATAKDAARVEYLLARLRFTGSVKHSAETARVQISRLMKPVSLSPADRRMRWSMFNSWARRPASVSAA